MALDCGIDIGSTNLKVVLVNEEGRTVFVRSVPSPRVSDGIGQVTDALGLVRLLEDLIIDGWVQFGMGLPLRSIVTTGVGEDGVGVEADLRPTGPAIPWFDRRAAGEVQSLRGLGDFTDRTGIAVDFDRTLTKWAWLRRHRAKELERARCWIALTDFPAVWWSGKTFMSASLAPRTACYDITRGEWVGELLTAIAAPPLPEIKGAGQIVGGIRAGRLRETGAASSETIVAAGGHDHPVAASVIRRFDPKGLVDSLGTANLLYGELPMKRPLPRIPGLAFSIPPSGEKALSCLGVLELGAALDVAKSQGDVFWNFLAQARLPGAPPEKAAELDDGVIDPRNIRRILENLSLKARQLLAAMNGAGVEGGAIYTSGGWSRSPGFMELRASVFGQRIHVVEDMEVSAVGAALFGAQAATGKSTSPLKVQDIQVIEPVAEWVLSYNKLFASTHEAHRPPD